MAAEVHVGDIGTVFQTNVKDQDGNVIDCSACDLMQIIFVKPNGFKLIKPMIFVNTGSDGQLQYIAVSGDLDTVGVWRRQTYIHFPNGNDWYTDIASFMVQPNL